MFKNGRPLPSSPQGTVYTGVDYMRIQSVDQVHAGTYKISSRNCAGEGHISFQLTVKGTSAPI